MVMLGMVAAAAVRRLLLIHLSLQNNFGPFVVCDGVLHILLPKFIFSPFVFVVDVALRTISPHFQSSLPLDQRHLFECVPIGHLLGRSHTNLKCELKRGSKAWI
jgi:hypothetical protein